MIPYLTDRYNAASAKKPNDSERHRIHMSSARTAQTLVAMTSAARPCVDRGYSWLLGTTVSESPIFTHVTNGNFRNGTKRSTRRLKRRLT